MIMSRTPFRISFFGGGTDYPAWYRDNGGSVLATSIDKHCYISCRYLPPFFEHRHRIVYSSTENVKTNSEIKHPAVKAVFNFLEIEKGLELHHDGDLPARSGLGSSSAFTVGLLHTLKALRGELMTKRELAQTAIHIEQNLIKENVGSQDQITSAYGGFNRIDFHRDDTFSVHPVILSREVKSYIESHLMLFFTGFSRFASDIAKSKIENFKKRETELRTLHQMVDEGSSILHSNPDGLDAFGKLLHESWKFKRSLSDSVSNPEINEIYEAGLSEGALGGKLLGAGGGGFMLFYVKPELRNRLKERLKNLVHVDFKFETEGSKIVVYEPNL